MDGTAPDEGDGVRVRGERRLTFTDGYNAELLVFDLAAKEAPDA